MCEKITCQVVRDLLPNYIEGLTGEETNEAVAHHLEGCEDCRSLHEKLKAELHAPKFEKRDLIRLLKAIRKAKLTQILLAVAAGILLTWLVIFAMGSGLSAIAPDEIQVKNVYKLSDGSLAMTYTVNGLDNSMLLANSSAQYGNGDYAFEIRTSFWYRLFGRSDPERQTLYQQIYPARNLYPDGTRGADIETLIISYGYGKNSRELWRKSGPVETAPPEFEIYLQSGRRQSYETFREDYLWRLSVADPSPTPTPRVTPKPAEPVK